MKHSYLSSAKIIPDITNFFSLGILGMQNIFDTTLKEYLVRYSDEIGEVEGYYSYFVLIFY